MDIVAVQLAETLPPSQRMLVDDYFVVQDDVVDRRVRRKSGSVVITTMGRAQRRHDENIAERADRAWLTASQRPEPGTGRAVRAVDLYSGCGGLTLGLAEAARAVGRDFRPVAAFDSNKDARESYAANFADAAVERDVTNVFSGYWGSSLTPLERGLKKKVGDIDFLVAGPPCQGWSSLNNHTRGTDPKNRLYRRVARAAEVLEPTYVLVENVIGARDARSSSATIDRLHELGYDVSDAVVSLASIGVAQRRRRHVVLAVQQSAATQLVEILKAFSVRERTLRWAIEDLRGLEPEEDFDRPSRVSEANRSRMRWLREHASPDLPNVLRPKCHRDGDHSYVSMYGRLDWAESAQTITSGYGSMGQGRYVHPDAKRTLTPHEAARLQFFPDWFDFGERKRTIWATLIANAVPMKLSYVIALWLLR